MPSIITRGGMSARGFGFAGAAPLELQTVYFYSSQSWEVPAGVSSLASVTLVGGTGDAAYTTTQGFSATAVAYGGATAPPGATTFPVDYNYTTGYADSVLSTFNSGGTGTRNVTYVPLTAYGDGTVTGDFTTIYSVTGTVSSSSGPWDNTSNSTYVGPGYTVAGSQVVTVPATTGGTTSAFGYSAAGGTGTTGSTTNATDVSVTPGSSYGITVGADSGYVRVQYYT